MDAVTGAHELEVEALRPAWLRRALAFLEREWLLLVASAFFLGASVIASRLWFTSDSWYSVLYGRDVLRHGLPHEDTLTVMGHGHAWVDQQWLGHVALYGLFALGGAKLASLVCALLFSAAYVGVLALARARGASVRTIVAFALLGWPYSATWPQAEVFSRILFPALLLLLAAETRKPSRRVWLVFPTLVLWANLHGAVLLGAAVVALLGAVELLERRGSRVRAAVLLVAPWLCVVATPYGFSVLEYYRGTITNRSFHHYVGPWMPAVPFSLEGGAFFVLLALVGVAVVRHTRRLTGYELAVLAVTAVAALEAVRSIPWFVAASALFVAPLLQGGRRGARSPRLAIATAVLAVVVTLAALADAAVRPRSAYTRTYPPAAAAFVARYVQSHPGTRVFASDPLGDWLVYVQPSLWGKIAYDARWEQLTAAQVRDVYFFQHRVGRFWKAPTGGYRLLMLTRYVYPWLVKPFLNDLRYRVVYTDSRVVVLERAATRP